MSKHVLFVLTNHDQLGNTGRKTGWHCAEVSHPYWILRNAGCEISFASPDGGPVPMDPNSEDNRDTANADFMSDPLIQAALVNTIASQEIQAGTFDAIYFPGGHGTMWDLRGNEHLAKAIAYIYEMGGVVAAVCHGPAALLDVSLKNGERLIAGKQLTAFSDEEERAVELDQVVPFLLETELRKQGAIFSCAPKWQEKVVVSERLVTGQNPASASGVGREILKLLEKESKPKKATEPA